MVKKKNNELKSERRVIRNKLNIFPEELVIPFIKFALEVTPRIAFAVCISFYKGIRITEILNLSRDGLEHQFVSLKTKKKIDVFSESERQWLAQNFTSKQTGEDVIQFSLEVSGDILLGMYVYHIENYFPEDGSDNLFIDKRGKALTREQFRRDFRILKEKFINKLMSSEDANLKNYGTLLSLLPWSSDIGFRTALGFKIKKETEKVKYQWRKVK